MFIRSTKIKLHPPRNPDDFAGESVIIGCGHQRYCGKRHPYADFYTIDVLSEVSPDLLLDITHELPVNLHQRFKLTIMEGLPVWAYNEYASSHSSNAKKGFENMLAMTKEDGFIFMIGCPRNYERRSFLKEYKYVEFFNEMHALRFGEDDIDEETNIILIPKNQSLNIQEMKEQLNTLDVSALNYIKQFTPYHADMELQWVDTSQSLAHDTYLQVMIANMKAEEKDRQKNNLYLGVGISLALGIGFFAVRNTSLSINPFELSKKYLSNC